VLGSETGPGPRRAALPDLPVERGPAYKPRRSTAWTGQIEDS
jgi:hypothetical protein